MCLPHNEEKRSRKGIQFENIHAVQTEKAEAHLPSTDEGATTQNLDTWLISIH
jgi:hypothetical protein